MQLNTLIKIMIGAVGVILIFIVAFFLITNSRNEVLFTGLGQKVNSLNERVEKIEKEPVVSGESVTTSTQAKTTEWVEIPEVGLEILTPQGYTLSKAGKSERGGFLVYSFNQTGDITYFSLKSLEFFNEQTIKAFHDECGEENICYFGYAPTIESYNEQKRAFQTNSPYEGMFPIKFGNRNWLVSTEQCHGDGCYIRRYTSFKGSTLIEASIMMEFLSEEEKADNLFKEVKFSNL